MRTVLGTDRLRMQLLAALAGGTLVATSACGGNVHSEGIGGSAGSGAGGSSGAGGAAGSGTGGQAAGGTGGLPCSAADDTGLIICGTPECELCWSGQSWLSCWHPDDVPVWGGLEPSDAICPAPHAVQSSPYSACDWQSVWFASGSVQDGYCCYETMPACPGGRPFRVDGKLRVAAVAPSRDWAECGELQAELDPVTARALSDAWLADAQLEHASIAAFARLTLELLHLGAPPELVSASQAASLDEVGHARSCFALGSRFSGEPLGPGRLDVSGNLLALELERLVETTFEEGCVGETLAALIAGQARESATDRDVVSALEEIARDEASHAALAWRIVAWAVERGGASAEAALRRALSRALERERAVELPVLAPGVDRAAWARFGRLTPAALGELRAAGIRDVIVPCVEALLAQRAQPAAA